MLPHGTSDLDMLMDRISPMELLANGNGDLHLLTHGTSDLDMFTDRISAMELLTHGNGDLDLLTHRTRDLDMVTHRVNDSELLTHARSGADLLVYTVVYSGICAPQPARWWDGVLGPHDAARRARGSSV